MTDRVLLALALALLALVIAAVILHVAGVVPIFVSPDQDPGGPLPKSPNGALSSPVASLEQTEQ